MDCLFWPRFWTFSKLKPVYVFSSLPIQYIVINVDHKNRTPITEMQKIDGQIGNPNSVNVVV